MLVWLAAGWFTIWTLEAITYSFAFLAEAQGLPRLSSFRHSLTAEELRERGIRQCLR